MLLSNFLEDSARRYGGSTALIAGGERYSYAEMEQRAESVAGWLEGCGLRRGDRVVIYAGNTLETITAIFGTLKIGGVFVLIEPNVEGAKAGEIIVDCAPSMVVGAPDALAKVGPWLGKCPVGVTPAGREGVAEWARVREAGAEAPAFPFPDGNDGVAGRRRSGRIVDVDLASLIYTSGSTGKAKGVMHTHASMVAATLSINGYLHNSADDIILNTLPLSFDYGLYQVLLTFQVGGCLVLEPDFRVPHRVIESAVRYGVTGWPVQPTMVALMSRLKGLKSCDFETVRYLTSTGQALTAEQIRWLGRTFPQAEIFSMYGLTECKRVSYLDPAKVASKPGSVGQTMPNCETFLVDEDGRDVVDAGAVGELVVRGQNLMRGYWKNREATRAALRDSGDLRGTVLATGDLFYKDEEGDLYFVGRKDGIIKSGGQKVVPRLIEDTIASMPGVSEVAVVDIADEISGRVAMAFVVPDGTVELTDVAVIRYCRSRLDGFHIPKFVSIAPDLPMTSTGKIDRKLLQTRSPSLCEN